MTSIIHPRAGCTASISICTSLNSGRDKHSPPYSTSSSPSSSSSSSSSTSPTLPPYTNPSPPGYTALYPNTLSDDPGSGHVLLESSDGVRFCVPSFFLKATSEVFQEALADLGDDLNSNSDAKLKSRFEKNSRDVDMERAQAKTDLDKLSLDESSTVLAILIDIITGRPSSTLSLSMDDTTSLLHASTKYRIPSITLRIRLDILSTSSPFHLNPFRLYALCHEWGWNPEAQVALQRTLSYNISDPRIYKTLCGMKSELLMDVMSLRWMRVEGFKDGVALVISESESESISMVGGALNGLGQRLGLYRLQKRGPCPHAECGAEANACAAKWKYLVVEEFTRFPSGETVLDLPAFWERDDVKRCLHGGRSSVGASRSSSAGGRGGRCPHGYEGSPFDTKATMRRLKRLVASLPTTA